MGDSDADFAVFMEDKLHLLGVCDDGDDDARRLDETSDCRQGLSTDRNFWREINENQERYILLF